MEFLLSYFKSWQWCCESAALSMPANLKNSEWPQDWKRSIFIPIPKKGNAKECSNYCTIALVSHASKVMLKLLQARLQQYVNHELSDVQAGFRKGRETRDQVAKICWIMEKSRVPEKHLLLLYWLCQSLWLCGSQQTVESSSRDGNTRPLDLLPEKSIKKLHIELDMEQQNDSKLGEGYIKAVYCHSVYLVCRVHHVKFQAEWSTGLNQDCW